MLKCLHNYLLFLLIVQLYSILLYIYMARIIMHEIPRYASPFPPEWIGWACSRSSLKPCLLMGPWKRAFSTAGPVLWNILPPKSRRSPLSSVETWFKIWLFTQALGQDEVRVGQKVWVALGKRGCVLELSRFVGN